MTFAATPPPSPRPEKRSRVRRLLPLAIAAWALLEIWLLTVVGEAAGGLTVFLLLLAGLVIGGYVIKRAGRRAWKGMTASFQQTAESFQSAMGGMGGTGGTGAAGPAGATAEKGASTGQGSDAAGNTLSIVGGLLLMCPGLVSDAAGLLCLFPPTRKLISRRAEALLARQGQGAPGSLGDAFQQARMRRPDGKVVPGEVVREDEPPTPPSQDRQDREDPQLPR